MKSRSRWRRALADLRSLFFWPILAAALPRSLGYGLLKHLASRSGDFEPEADAAWRGCRLIVERGDEVEWKYRYRLLRWVERADTFLTLLRSRRWWARQVDLDAQWPNPARPSLLLTHHWGAGHWVWGVLQAHGQRAWFVARQPSVADLGAGRIALWYGALRGWSLRRIGGRGPLYTGGSARRVRAAMVAGDSVVGMLDLPANAGQRPMPVTLLDRAAQLPSRLIDVAREAAPTIAVFSCAFDFSSGRRRLRLRVLPDGLSTAEVLAAYAEDLSACLADASECWMMWHESSAIFTAPPRAVTP